MRPDPAQDGVVQGCGEFMPPLLKPHTSSAGPRCFAGRAPSWPARASTLWELRPSPAGLASLQVESGLVGGAPFELGGADEVERRVAPQGIVEAVDVAGQVVSRLGPGQEHGAPHEFALQGLEERLDHRVVVAVPLAGHRDQGAVTPQLGLVLDRAVLATAVRMVGQPSRRTSDREGSSQCGVRQFLVQAVADGPILLRAGQTGP